MSKSDVRGLSILHSRYFRSNEIRHFFDCYIYAESKPYCSCGLLHDLELYISSWELTNILYPKYERDVILKYQNIDIESATTEQLEELQKRQTECQQILTEAFGEFRPLAKKEAQEQYDVYKSLILNEFKDEFPGALKRLDSWLQKTQNSA